MADSPETKIMKALERRMVTFTPSAAKIVFPKNRSYAPESTSKPYIAAYMNLNGSQRVFIGSNDPHRFIGIMSVSVFWPKDQGTANPLNMAGAIADYFPADLRLTEDDVTVRVTKRPDVNGPLVETKWLHVPISIPYEAWA